MFGDKRFKKTGIFSNSKDVMSFQCVCNKKHKHLPYKVRGGKFDIFFWLDAAWVMCRAERPSVSYTKVTDIIARTGHNLQIYIKQIQKQISGNNKFRIKGTGNETDARAVRSDSLARRIE